MSTVRRVSTRLRAALGEGPKIIKKHALHEACVEIAKGKVWGHIRANTR